MFQTTEFRSWKKLFKGFSLSPHFIGKETEDQRATGPGLTLEFRCPSSAQRWFYYIFVAGAIEKVTHRFSVHDENNLLVLWISSLP